MIMRPVTKLQKEVTALSAKLHKITKAQETYAFEHCFPRNIGYFVKHTVWCTECGHQWETDETSLMLQSCGVKCHHCGKMLNVLYSRKKKEEYKEYYNIITRCHGYNVIRNFLVTRYNSIGHKPYLNIDECVQNWISPDGKLTIMARNSSGNCHCYDLWIFSSPLTIKTRHTTYYGYDLSEKYNIYAKTIYPRMYVTPILKRNGFKGHFHGISPVSLFTLLLTNSKAETLFKAQQYALVYFIAYNMITDKTDKLFNVAKICMRNKYIVSDAKMWDDYIRLLDYFHKDLHNAKYVCPDNLKVAHDTLMDKKAKIEKVEHERAEIAKMKAERENYIKHMGKFFGLLITDDNLVIRPLKSVDEFYEEGQKMHHCVYQCEYFKRHDSLILTTRDKEGNRIETIEVNLRLYRVVQSRGVCNKNSEYHDRIVSLVNNNMNVIRKYNVAL